MSKKLFLVLIVCICFALSSCGLDKNSLEDFFAEWTPEKDNSVAIFGPDYDGILFYNGKEIDTKPIIEKHFGYFNQLNHLAVVDGNLYSTAYYTISEDERTDTHMCSLDIYKLNLTYLTFEVVFSDLYTPSDIFESFYPDVFYSNRIVYVYDGVSKTEYNIDKKVSVRSETNDFTPPSIGKYKVEYVRNNDGTVDYNYIKITGDSFEKILTFDYIANRNEYIDRLRALDNEPTRLEDLLNITMPLDEFFCSAFSIGDKVYLHCQVFDEDGERNSIFISYDCKKDSFTFLRHIFSPWSSRSKVIPVE